MSNGTVSDEEWRQFIGPGGEVVTILMLFLPIIFVVVVTLIPRPLPTTVSLPLSAVLLFVIRLAYLSSDVINTCAAMIQGMIEVFTPLSIICGAIYLFNIMESTGCMKWMMRELKILSKGHPVAEFMLIAWAFAYLVEGSSGFGTPAALAAPMLAQLGHNKFRSVVAVLLTNTVATVFGAVGTPIWYGLGTVVDKYYAEDPTDALGKIGFQAACALATMALIVPFCAGLYLIPRKVLFQNIIFFALSVCSVMLPVVGISFFSYEFPTILGGMIGLAITAILTTFRIGLRDFDPDDMGEEWQMLNQMGELYEKAQKDSKDLTIEVHLDHESDSIIEDDVNGKQSEKKEKDVPGYEFSLNITGQSEACENSHSDVESQDDSTTKKNDCDSKSIESVEPKVYELKEREVGREYAKAFALRTLPITGTILILIFTRIEQIGIKNLLTTTSPSLGVQLGNLFWFQISPNLKMLFNNILTDTTVSSKYETLYVPCVIPFFIVSLITSAIFWSDMKKMKTNPWKEILNLLPRVKGAAIALLGGLMLVSLIRNGGYASPAYLIGSILSDWTGAFWIIISPFLGALGSFFSGSTAVSNLTFGEVQYVAASNSGYDPLFVLAVQAFGASIGNCVCLNNIIAARAVIGLDHIGEGKFLVLTAPIAFVTILVTTGFMYLYFGL